MAVLHQLMQSDERAWRDCVSFLLEGDVALLVDDGVGLLARPEVIQQLRAKVVPEGLAALRADVLARGLGDACEKHGVQLLDDEGWVEWVLAHERSLSWK